MLQTGVPSELVASLRGLSDEDLVARLTSLAARERREAAALVAHLAELETRGLHLRAGYGSLFVYCRDALRLSEHEAYNRIEVARACRRFPAILERLEEGALNLTSVRLLAPYLTPENHEAVLEEARGKRKAQVEELVARLAPWPDVPPVVRKLPPPRAAATPGLSEPVSGAHAGRTPAAPPGVDAPIAAPGADASGALYPAADARPEAAPADSPTTLASAGRLPAPPSAQLDAVPGSADAPVTPRAPTSPTVPRPAVVVPLSPDRYKLQVTIGGGTLEKLRLAQDMLRHAVPSGDAAVLLDRALTVLLADLARKRFAATDNPRASTGVAPGSRHIPAEVRRVVWLRDLGRCAFVARDGRRCAERAFVEFHHLRPHALGGEATVGNIQLRCRRHNSYEAQADFGRAHSFRNESREPPT